MAPVYTMGVYWNDGASVYICMCVDMWFGNKVLRLTRIFIFCFRAQYKVHENLQLLILIHFFSSEFFHVFSTILNIHVVTTFF